MPYTGTESDDNITTQPPLNIKCEWCYHLMYFENIVINVASIYFPLFSSRTLPATW